MKTVRTGVLIVEDNPLIAEGISRMIRWEERGCILVGKAETVDEAIELVKSGHPSLVITDIRMPGKSGIELLRFLKVNYPGIRTIVISAYDDFSYAKEAVKAGSVNYLLKPVDPEELDSAVRAAMAGVEALEPLEYGIQAMLVIRTSMEINESEMKRLIPSFCREKPERMDSCLYRFCFAQKPGMMQIAQIVSGLEVKKLWGYAEKQQEESELVLYQQALAAAADSLAYADLAKDRRLVRSKESELRLLAASGQLDRLSEEIHAIAAEHYSRQCFSFQMLAGEILQFFMILQQGEYSRGDLFHKVEELSERHRLELVYFSMEDYLKDVEILLEEYLDSFRLIRGGRDELVVRVKHMIRENYCQDISLNRIAELFYVSPSYLSRTFSQKEGQTLSQYIIRVRMEKARELLERTELKVSVIAEMVGYSDPNYFSRIYKKTFGSLPSSLKN